MSPSTRSILAFSMGSALFLAVSVVSASDAGRDFSQCVHTCNSARKACGDQCLLDCKALFAQNSSQRGACTGSCSSTCVKSETDCKAVCKAIKRGDCPNQP